ncbi:heparin-binding hemagglutinin [Gordonia sp. OPL2]|uniref:heparin-binding hemagglutinin n=1 Tax=Gordonia sp. OPL2 TaxID=2486274 RepID=UPI0016562FBA|nr:heparin-binding hemagglutinin [Gordonia sp. OPL2]ROZ89235.1 heparin-binding hemagglutinin [Gordonia sp. OPL2]
MSESTRTLANPIYAAVGAGDYVVAQFNDIVAQLRERTESATETAQARLEQTRGDAQARLDEARTRLNALPEDVPAQIEDLRGKLNSDELRKVAEGYLESATGFYNSLAERGEETVERLRQQPLVQENLDRAEKVYNDAVDLTEDTLGVVSSQTRLVGERAAKLTGRVSSRVEDVAADIEQAGQTIKSEAADAASEIDGAAGTVEAKGRTAKASPAKKITAAKKAPAKKAPAKKAPAKKATS